MFPSTCRKKPLDNTSLFDWQEQAWRKLAPMVTARAYPCGVMDKSRARLLVAGGFNNKELESMEIFDVKTERWLKAPAMPTARTKCGGAIVGDYFAVVGYQLMYSYSAGFCMTATFLF